MPHLAFILFFFALGACIGSFLNVVVWRLPRGESLVAPPSRCPICLTPLAWYDNIPVLGWLALRGRCRYCHNPISIRYPVVEFLTGALFVFYYVMFFIVQEGPRPPVGALWFERTIQEHWMVYLLYVFAVSCLLAASLIDAETFEIPQSIPLLMALVGVLYHALLDRPDRPGSLRLDPRGVGSLLAAGGTIGLAAGLLCLWTGLLKRSFAHGYPMLEVEMNPPAAPAPGSVGRLIGRLIDAYRGKLSRPDQAVMERRRREADEREKEDLRLKEKEARANSAPQPQATEFTAADVRRETRREMVFLMFPLAGAFLAVVLARRVPALADAWASLMQNDHANGLMGALLGALVGGFWVWLARVLGGLIAGREAMGLGDVDLMFGAGAILGAGPVTVAFFLAPFFGLAVALPRLFSGRGRELPYGPSLGIGTAVVMLYYWPIADWLTPGLSAMMQIIGAKIGLG